MIGPVPITSALRTLIDLAVDLDDAALELAMEAPFAAGSPARSSSPGASKTSAARGALGAQRCATFSKHAAAQPTAAGKFA
jgi:hypothetical protein